MSSLQAGVSQIHTETSVLDSKRQQAVEAFGSSKNVSFVKYRPTLFWSQDKRDRLCALVSKRYDRAQGAYWYGFHPRGEEFLKGGENSHLVLACVDRNEAFAIPYAFLKENLLNLNTTSREDGSMYWHILLAVAENDELALNLSKIGKKIDLAPFRYPLKRAT